MLVFVSLPANVSAGKYPAGDVYLYNYIINLCYNKFMTNKFETKEEASAAAGEALNKLLEDNKKIPFY